MGGSQLEIGPPLTASRRTRRPIPRTEEIYPISERLLRRKKGLQRSQSDRGGRIYSLPSFLYSPWGKGRVEIEPRIGFREREVETGGGAREKLRDELALASGKS